MKNFRKVSSRLQLSVPSCDSLCTRLLKPETLSIPAAHAVALVTQSVKGAGDVASPIERSRIASQVAFAFRGSASEGAEMKRTRKSGPGSIGRGRLNRLSFAWFRDASAPPRHRRRARIAIDLGPDPVLSERHRCSAVWYRARTGAWRPGLNGSALPGKAFDPFSGTGQPVGACRTCFSSRACGDIGLSSSFRIVGESPDSRRELPNSGRESGNSRRLRAKVTEVRYLRKLPKLHVIVSNLGRVVVRLMTSTGFAGVQEGGPSLCGSRPGARRRSSGMRWPRAMDTKHFFDRIRTLESAQILGVM